MTTMQADTVTADTRRKVQAVSGGVHFLTDAELAQAVDVPAGPVDPGRPVKLVTRQPDPRPAWPLVLVEGPAHSDPSEQAIRLTRSPRIGASFLLALGTDPDEYAHTPNARYDIVELDGTWGQLLGVVDALHNECTKLAVQGITPLVILDSMSAVWRLLCQWAANRATSNAKASAVLATDPNADVGISPLYWTAAGDRHAELLARLFTMPAIKVVTARGDWERVTGPDESLRDAREYRIRAHPELPASAHAWVRLSREECPQLIGLRRGPWPVIRPGRDAPALLRPYPERGIPSFSLHYLLFHAMRFDPAEARVPQLVRPVADAEPAPLHLRTVEVPEGSDEQPGAPLDDELTPAV